MKRMRIRVILYAGWLVFFFIIDRMLSPISISNATITLIFVMTIMTLVMPRKPIMPVWLLMLIPISALLMIKIWDGKLLGNQDIFLAILEACLIALTTILASWVNAALGEFESSVAQITLGKHEKTPEPSVMGQGSIYREVRRARNHQRPLALISIGVEEKSIKLAVEKMVQEIQLSMMKQYKLQKLSKMLCDELEDCAVIVRDTDRFLAVLPETLPEELPVVLERLRQKASDQVSIELKIGIATLPQDANTFEGLVDRATQAMENDQELQPNVGLDSYPVERRNN